MADGKVFTLGVGGVLSCLNAADGKLLWRKDEFPKVVPQYFAATSPLVVDGLCVAQLGGRGNGAMMAFVVASGEMKWKGPAGGPGYSSPVLMTVDGTKQIITLTDSSVISVALADGKLLWEIPFAPRGMAYNAATPIIDGQTVIYTGQGRGTTAVKIEKQADGTFAPKQLWTNPQLGTQFDTPVLKDGLLFGLSDKGNLYCMDAKTGEQKWADPTVHKSAGAFGAILDAGSVLLALPDNSELIAYKPNDKQFEAVGTTKVADTPTYAHPVIEGKRVFVKDQDSVTLWTF